LLQQSKYELVFFLVTFEQGKLEMKNILDSISFINFKLYILQGI